MSIGRPVMPGPDPHAPLATAAPPMEDERELLALGAEPVASAVAKKPLLGSYLPVNPVQRYTFKKWTPGDWSRHNDSKVFQSSRDRDAART